ncbi:MAG: FAD-dependent oxidoreductase, partial [Acidimicrobiales bacterium]|nr:FAD-dependent oxidoreductase [Acidimicrobiales bacterium]
MSDRAAHALGKAYRDIVRASYGDLGHPPDVVAFPANEADVIAILDWCSSAGIAAVPYGGGSSVVGGVEYRGEGGFGAWVSIDLTRLDRVVEIDRVSRAARIQAGALGPVLEEQLRPQGYTLRH